MATNRYDIFSEDSREEDNRDNIKDLLEKSIKNEIKRKIDILHGIFSCLQKEDFLNYKL